MSDTSDNGLPQQVLLNKWLKWGSSLAALIIAALISPPTHFVAPGGIVKALIPIILAVFLMVFIPTGNQNTSWFTRTRTLVFLSAAIILYLFYSNWIGYYEIENNGKTYLKGSYYTPEASKLISDSLKQGHKEKDEDVLELMGSGENIRSVWTEASILKVETISLVVYIISVVAFGLTIIGAFSYRLSKAGNSDSHSRNEKSNTQNHARKLRKSTGASKPRSRFIKQN